MFAARKAISFGLGTSQKDVIVISKGFGAYLDRLAKQLGQSKVPLAIPRS